MVFYSLQDYPAGCKDRQVVWLFTNFLTFQAFTLLKIVLLFKTLQFFFFFLFLNPGLTSVDVRHRLPICIFQEHPSLIQHDGWHFPSPRRARDLWAKTSSCEMSHPSVLNITVNTNGSLFAICGPSGSSFKGPGRLLCIQVNMRWQGELFELSHRGI